LLLAVLSERPQAWGLGIDASSGAVAAAAANAAPLGLTDRARFVQRDWTQPDWRSGLVEGIASPRFDVILANPPYIPDGDIPGLEPEVTRFDPLAALAGGTDGLDAYRRLAPQLPDLLTPNGVVVFEVGFGQARQVAALFVAAGLQCLGTRTDLGGIERCVLARSARRSIG
jgi:release factor glutamine methyltransferase